MRKSVLKMWVRCLLHFGILVTIINQFSSRFWAQQQWPWSDTKLYIRKFRFTGLNQSQDYVLSWSVVNLYKISTGQCFPIKIVVELINPKAPKKYKLTLIWFCSPVRDKKEGTILAKYKVICVININFFKFLCSKSVNCYRWLTHPICRRFADGF